MKIKLLTLFILIALVSCRHPTAITTKADSVNSQNHLKKDTTLVKAIAKKIKDSIIIISLDSRFMLRCVDYNEPNYDQYFEIIRHGKRIFTDTAHAYVFENKLYPILRKIDSNTFELLVEEDNRPSNNLGMLFRIVNNAVTSEAELPGFDGKENVGNTIEYYGRWDASEIWGTSGKMYTTYNPILYYKLTETGIRIDSALSIKKTKAEYGHFYGFEYSEKIGIPINKQGHIIIDTTGKNILRKKS